MGSYLNPKNKSFWEAIRSEIYIDKTKLIAYTNKCVNTQQKYICVSRPRRFGKTMALNMLAAYYSRGCDSRDLFAGCQIASDISYGEHLNQYDVIYINMQHFLIGIDNQEVTAYLEREVLGELLEDYGDILQNPDVSLVDAGGWYDGYMFTHFQHVYNPQSVVEAMLCHKFSNYWTSTETYDALKIYIDMDFDGLRSDLVEMLGGGRVKVNTHSFQNDMCSFKVKDDVLTLLIHLGYLGYDFAAKEAFIPNREIIEEFENAMSVSGWPEIMRILKASEKLLWDTLNGDAQRVAEGLDRAHMEAASILTYNDENSLACAVSLAYYSARKDYLIVREFPAGHGYADLVFLPLPHTRKPAMIVELKYDKSAETAIKQMKDRYDTQALEHYEGEILLVAVNYDKTHLDKPHSCLIEKVVKAD